MAKIKPGDKVIGKVGPKDVRGTVTEVDESKSTENPRLYIDTDGGGKASLKANNVVKDD